MPGLDFPSRSLSLVRAHLKRKYNRLVIGVRWTADSSCVEKQGVEKGGDSEESLLHWPGSLC
jgi:hypothetical protein